MPFLPTFRRISFLLHNSPYTLHSVPSVYPRSFASSTFPTQPSTSPIPARSQNGINREKQEPPGSIRQAGPPTAAQWGKMEQGRKQMKHRRSCACINHRISPSSEFWGRFHLAIVTTRAQLLRSCYDASNNLSNRLDSLRAQKLRIYRISSHLFLPVNSWNLTPPR
jgi:hypothetical protein